MKITHLSQAELNKLFSQSESHFLDFKGRAIQPAKLTRTVSAFGNADGGEIFLGIDEQVAGGPKTWAITCWWPFTASWVAPMARSGI